MFDAISSDTVIIWQPSSPNARETLFLDLADAPLLDCLYLDWRSQLKEIETKAVLENLSNFLRNHVFDLKLCKKQEVLKLVNKAKTLPLEYFIENKTGVCRHFSLAAYYFLERARTEQFLPILSVEIIRKNFMNGRHSWLYVALKDGSFHFDPYWGILISMSESEEIKSSYEYNLF